MGEEVLGRVERERRVAEAKATLRLEGMSLTVEEAALVRRWVDGKITLKELRRLLMELPT